MTESDKVREHFLNGITGTINDMEAGLTTKTEGVNELLELFVKALEPCVKTREHLQLFIYRVKTMREEQVKYFNGEYKALIVAKRLEVQVDNAITKLVNELGYSTGEITKKYEQQKLL